MKRAKWAEHKLFVREAWVLTKELHSKTLVLLVWTKTPQKSMPIAEGRLWKTFYSQQLCPRSCATVRIAQLASARLELSKEAKISGKNSWIQGLQRGAQWGSMGQGMGALCPAEALEVVHTDPLYDYCHTNGLVPMFYHESLHTTQLPKTPGMPVSWLTSPGKFRSQGRLPSTLTHPCSSSLCVLP